MSESKPRLCIDCRWCYVGENDEENALCRHPLNYQPDKISRVTGRSVHKYIGTAFCAAQRIGLNECGEAGTRWERTTGDGVGVDNSR